MYRRWTMLRLPLTPNPPRRFFGGTPAPHELRWIVGVTGIALFVLSIYLGNVAFNLLANRYEHYDTPTIAVRDDGAVRYQAISPRDAFKESLGLWFVYLMSPAIMLTVAGLIFWRLCPDSTFDEGEDTPHEDYVLLGNCVFLGFLMTFLLLISYDCVRSARKHVHTVVVSEDRVEFQASWRTWDVARSDVARISNERTDEPEHELYFPDRSAWRFTLADGERAISHDLMHEERTLFHEMSEVYLAMKEHIMTGEAPDNP